jgi:membrane associated rhomboid family serine protease
MCPHCRAFITTSDKVCPYCGERVGPRAVELRGGAQDFLAGFIPHARFTTVIILVINFGLYLATVLYSMRGGQGNIVDIDGRTLLAFGAKFGPAIGAGQWWRLVTAGFLHGGLMHILMNSWAMFDLGAAVEEMYGTARMLVIYFVANVVGFYLSALWNPGTLSIGASAAICGLLGAMIALGLRDRSSIGDAMRGTYLRWLVFIMVISLFGRIDMAAHVGGVAGGFSVAYLAGQPRLGGGPLEIIWRVGAWVAVLLTAVSFLAWFRWFMRATAY